MQIRSHNACFKQLIPFICMIRCYLLMNRLVYNTCNYLDKTHNTSVVNELGIEKESFESLFVIKNLYFWWRNPTNDSLNDSINSEPSLCRYVNDIFPSHVKLLLKLFLNHFHISPLQVNLVYNWDNCQTRFKSLPEVA